MIASAFDRTVNVPEIEGEGHRLAVPRSKQRLDVLREADRLIGGWSGHGDLLDDDTSTRQGGLGSSRLPCASP